MGKRCSLFRQPEIKSPLKRYRFEIAEEVIDLAQDDEDITQETEAPEKSPDYCWYYTEEDFIYSLREQIMEKLEACGAAVRNVTKMIPDKYGDPTDNYGDFYEISRITPEVKETYFGTRLSKAKALLASFTEKEFAGAAGNSQASEKVREITSLLEEEHDDAVRLYDSNGNSRDITLDAFVREADPNKTYYVGWAVQFEDNVGPV